MKKDRKIKSAGMSDRDKNLLFIVGGILLVVHSHPVWFPQLLSREQRTEGN